MVRRIMPQDGSDVYEGAPKDGDVEIHDGADTWPTEDLR
jgi:hypothetical protein